MSQGELLLLLVVVTLFVGRIQGATPRNLQDVFIGRCYEYQQVLPYQQWITSQKNCSELWNKFYRSFAYKDPCSLDVNSYNEFLAAAQHNITTYNRAQYWSGQVTPLVYEYTARGRRYVTIREYLAGYTVQDVYEWCGKVESEQDGPGMDFESCPPWGSCPDGKMPASESFWKALSSHFASFVEGNVRVLLNGSNGQAFRNYSTFGSYELPFLAPPRNPILYVQLIHDILPRDNSITETCQNGTLLQLKDQVEKQGMVFNCTDDPIDLLYFQCVDYVGAARCSSLQERTQSTIVRSGDETKSNSATSNSLFMSGNVLALIAITAMSTYYTAERVGL